MRADLYVSFRRRIEPDLEKAMLAIPRKQRAMIRKGAKLGLTSEIDDRIDRFYEIYATSLRNLGTPVLSKRYFRVLKDVFAEKKKSSPQIRQIAQIQKKSIAAKRHKKHKTRSGTTSPGNRESSLCLLCLFVANLFLCNLRNLWTNFPPATESPPLTHRPPHSTLQSFPDAGEQRARRLTGLDQSRR